MKRLALVVVALAVLGSLDSRLVAQGPARLLKAAMNTELVDGDPKAAIEQYKKVAASGDRALAAQALLRMAGCYQKLGDAEAQKIYARLIRDYADQAESAAAARTRLAALQSPVVAAGPTARQIWAGDGANEYASVSPDGRYMSFVGFGVEDVGVRDLLTGTIRRLTNEANYRQPDGRSILAEYSVISRDGRQVAYQWFMPAEPPPGREQAELRILPLTGAEASQPRVVLRTDYLEVFDWTPDGKNLLVVLEPPDNTRQIAFVSIADGSVHTLKTLGVRDRETPWARPDKVSLSPDGRYVAYDTPRRDGESARDIFVLNADGSQETVAVEHRANDSRPVWSADGSQLLFVSDRSGKNALWRVPIDGGRPTGPAVLIKEELSGIVPLGTTRAGVLHYVLEGQQRSNVYVAALDEGSKVTGAPAFVTDRFVGSNGGPAWSHDGQYLAYRASRGLNLTFDMVADTVLVIRMLKTGEERDIPLSLRVDAQGGAGLKWFPDGRSVLVVARARTPVEGRHHVFYRVDVASGRAELLLSTRGTYHQMSDPGLSPDGRTIYYIHGADDERPSRQLVRFDLESRRETILKRGQLVSPRVAVSPDGAEVAYLVKNPSSSRVEIEVMPAGGGEPRQVSLGTSRSGDDPIEGLTWTPDQRSLLFVRTGARPFSLWRVAATGGEPENMGISGLLTPRVHPDGRRIAFEVREDLPSSVWTLDNFLPTRRAAR